MPVMAAAALSFMSRLTVLPRRTVVAAAAASCTVVQWMAGREVAPSKAWPRGGSTACGSERITPAVRQRYVRYDRHIRYIRHVRYVRYVRYIHRSFCVER